MEFLTSQFIAFPSGHHLGFHGISWWAFGQLENALQCFLPTG
jgi:hypothetical protein